LFRSDSDPVPLYTQLKEIPTILAVTYKGAAMKMFEETGAKFLLIFATIFSLFAGAIAFAVSYNNLRVTMAERNWELATMMILGFHRWEVFRVLAAEVLLLVLAFIPLGWVMGFYNARYLLHRLSMEDFPIPFRVDPSSFVLSTVVVLLATSVSFFLIFKRLQAMDFVATLKSRG
jgi:putative ABC transport system permease protein